MKPNMGSADRLIRILVAVVLSVLFFTGTISGTTGALLIIAGGVFLATSFLGFCPMYTIFGISTCPRK
jgi:hypothetical protein